MSVEDKINGHEPADKDVRRYQAIQGWDNDTIIYDTKNAAAWVQAEFSFPVEDMV